MTGGLDSAGIAWIRDPRLVRGLDYYRHTAFEFVTDRLGSQGALIAGGRYDGLIETLGGPPTPAVGWAAGIERLAMLVEEGKIGWDEPVVTYLPDFRMSDPRVTEMMTVRDLLVHRSGLALGAGDLMQFPKSDHSAAEIMAGLPHLKLARGFRSGYAYDNILYVVAGILTERVSGMPWEAFITRRIFAPLDMPTAVANLLRTMIENGRLAALPEVAAQFHALVNQSAGVSDAVIHSAFPIEPAQLVRVPHHDVFDPGRRRRTACHRRCRHQRNRHHRRRPTCPHRRTRRSTRPGSPPSSTC